MGLRGPVDAGWPLGRDVLNVRVTVTYNIEIGRQVGGEVVVRRNPVTRSWGTVGVGHDVGAISLQNG